MSHRIWGLRGIVALLVGAAFAAALAGCGGSGGGSSAQSVLKQTFSGSHKVDSGNLQFSVTIDPTGSSTLKTPISLNFGGPFQSLGSGKLPESNFSVSLGSNGQSVKLGILSTGQAGYVSLDGANYQLPAANFKELESSFSSITSTGGGGSGSSGALSKLGISPLRWLVKPSVVGTETVGGASTTHVRADLNVPALLNDVSTFLGKASSVGVPGSAGLPSSISATTRQKIASEVQSPSFDVWTGSSDKTIRKLEIALTIPVTGEISTLLGGLSSARVDVTLQYSDLNKPQTITAPTNVQPYSQFAGKLQQFVQTIEGTALSGSGTGTAPSTGTNTGAGTTTTPAAGGTATTPTDNSPYGRCVAAAGSDISKLQQCAPLINK